MGLDFGIFWEHLSLLGKIYWAVAIPSTFIFLISFVLSLLGNDSHTGGGDIDGDFGQIGIGDYFLNFKAIMSFFTMFAWIGVTGTNSNMANITIIIISIVAGIIMMFLVAVLLFYMNKLQSSGTLNFNNAIGLVGYVYLTIPAKRQSIGKIQIKIQGSLRTLDAMTEEVEPIKTDTNVEVIEILADNILLVKTKH